MRHRSATVRPVNVLASSNAPPLDAHPKVVGDPGPFSK
jgi:hypothetical protein